MRGDGGSIDRGLQDDGIAADDRCCGHSGHDGEGKVPGRDDGSDAERDVAELVVLAGELDGRGRGVQLERFAAVELEKVDGLAYVGVGLAPVLSDLEGEPGAELELALSNQVGSAEEKGSALGGGGPAPGREGGERGGDGLLGKIGLGALMDSDDLGWPRRVDRDDLALGLQAAAADDQVVLPSELGFDIGKSLLHRPLVFGVVEVDERLVDEGGLCGARGGGGGEISGCHNSSF